MKKKGEKKEEVAVQEGVGNLAPLAPTRSRTRHPSSNHPKWSTEEDDLLKELMKEYETNQTTPKWTELAKKFTNKTPHQVSDRWAKVLNPALLKGSWTGEEDMIIVEWVKQNGPKNWGALADNLPGRISKQCRERWHNHLCPNVNKMEWTAEEDLILIEHQKKWGNKWSKIAALLPGRTDNSVKNRWNSSLKRRLERISSGQEPAFKRGRKPKRASEAPNVSVQHEEEKNGPTESTSVSISIPVPPPMLEELPSSSQVSEKNTSNNTPLNINANDIPKPDFDENVGTKPSDTIFSPIRMDSPSITPLTPGKQWLNSPAGSLFSPSITWSPSQSPYLWKDTLGSAASPFPNISNIMGDKIPDISMSGLSVPKLD